MSPVTHFFAGWLLASVSPAGKPTTLTRREKALVVAAAVVPDIDGIGIIPELLTRNTSHPLLWFSQYHHSLHTLAFSLVCTVAAYLIAGPLAGFTCRSKLSKDRAATRRRIQGLPIRALTALLVFVSFHLHLLCDLIGARGPDGDQWPIPYLKPFSNSVQARLARPVGAQRLAELCDYRLLAAGHILDRVEVRQLAGGAGICRLAYEAGNCTEK